MMSSKKIIIQKCDDPQLWYSSKIGQVINVVDTRHDVYLCREDAGYLNIVKKSDAILVI